MSEAGAKGRSQTVRTVQEYAILNGLLPVSGPTLNGDALRGLWNRLSTREGLRFVQRTITYGEWVSDDASRPSS